MKLNSIISNILTSPAKRFYYLRKLGFYDKLSDEDYLKKYYKSKTGKELDLEHPRTFNEKMQWLKIHDRNPTYTDMVDKYESKRFVSEIIGDEHIIPTLGVWEKVEDIDFQLLPEKFVLKCTHDSGGIVICKDKEQFDSNACRTVLQKSLKRNYYLRNGREWPYKNVKPRILAEQYMQQEDGSGLVDYKFFCFNGKPLFLYISRGLDYHPTAQIGFYDMNGSEMRFHRSDYRPYHDAVIPSSFEDMKAVAERLAIKVDSPFVRIDLYSIYCKVFFSEITFSPCGGVIPFEPISADEELGKLLKLPTDE